MAINLTDKYPAAEQPLSPPAERKRKVFWVVLLGGVLLVGALVFFLVRVNRVEKTPAPITNAVTSVDVSATAAVSEQVTSFIQTTGSLAGSETSDVASPASGQVVATPIDVGAYVTQGIVIARLDERDARLKLQQAQATEQQAAAALRQAQARLGLGQGGSFDPNAVPEVRAARQAVESAEAQARLAEANARRYENLVETGDVARSVFDQYRAQAETARAQANAARQQYEAAVNTARQSNQGISGAQAALDAARAQTAQAQKALGDTNIRAPLSGFVSDRPIAVGEYVTPTVKIATIVKTDPLKVNLQLPEADTARVRVGMPMVLRVAAFPDREFSGIITALNPAIDPASRAMIVEARVPNPNNQLQPGMFATARIILPNSSEGVFVPREAVVTDAAANSSSVFVIEGNTARVRVVQLGQEKDNLVQIVSGVNAGETVATRNLSQLFDGAPVRRK